MAEAQLVIDGTPFPGDANPVVSELDMLATTEGSDPFTLNAVVGAWYRPVPAVEFGIAGQIIPSQIETESTLHIDPLAYARNRDGVTRTVDGADEESRRIGLQHSIIFYRMPPTGDVTADMLAVQRRSAADIQSVITPRRSGAACEIRYADFVERPPGSAADRAKWSDPSLWLDTSHPSPTLGKLILPALLAGSGAE